MLLTTTVKALRSKGMGYNFECSQKSNTQIGGKNAHVKRCVVCASTWLHGSLYLYEFLRGRWRFGIFHNSQMQAILSFFRRRLLLLVLLMLMLSICIVRFLNVMCAFLSWLNIVGFTGGLPLIKHNDCAFFCLLTPPVSSFLCMRVCVMRCEKFYWLSKYLPVDVDAVRV